MGHAIDYGFLNAKTEKEAMKEGLALAEEFAYMNVDPYENPSRSYHGDFNFYNRTFTTWEDALDFFRNGFYKDGVCLVKKPSESLEHRYSEKIRKARMKKNEYWDNQLEKFRLRKSATVGCKMCGSRFPKEHINNLHCPSCGNPLYSSTVKERLKKYNKDINDIEDWYKGEIAKKGKPTYWYKVEVHC